MRASKYCGFRGVKTKMFRGNRLLRLLRFALLCLPLAGMSWAAHINTNTSSKSKSQKKVSENQRTRRRIHRLARSRSAKLTQGFRQHAPSSRYYERFHMSSFAEDIAAW